MFQNYKCQGLAVSLFHMPQFSRFCNLQSKLAKLRQFALLPTSKGLPEKIIRFPSKSFNGFGFYLVYHTTFGRRLAEETIPLGVFLDLFVTDSVMGQQ